jgi:hypothetical protein
MRPWHAATIAFALLASAVTPWPGEWDAVGFVEAVSRFDLSAWAPHAPGYPVYVLASRAFAHVAPDAVRACGFASALGGALVVLALARASASRPWLGLLALASPVLSLVGASARSDALGLGLAAIALASPLRAPIAAGVLLSLSLGARPGYLVLVASIGLVRMVPSERRARLSFVAAFTATTCVWALWLLSAAGGVSRYVTLTHAHVSGHFSEWGGSAVTDPEMRTRLGDAARALADCLATDASVLGLLRAAVWSSLVVVGARTLDASRRRALVAVIAPYALVAFWTQNLAHEPRHLLPVALALLTLAAMGASHLLDHFARTSWRLALVSTSVIACLASASLMALWTQRTVAPAPVTFAHELLAQPDAREAVLFGGRSARLAAWAGLTARTCVYMGEVDVALSRFDHLPRRVYVSDEIRAQQGAAGRFGAPQRWCRDARVDRDHACLTVRRYDVLGR